MSANWFQERYRNDIAGPWLMTPLYHPRRWAGYSMRRWRWDSISYGGSYDGLWEYATHEKCAKLFLEETYGRQTGF
jgi:hypothetical protein